ncbi:MAG: endonuclease [Thiohalocapsa sp.]|jgi:endonuclease-3 related protein|uniref:endonuclease III domain-containing protein n=1 Tax=Thiohalocapsa sp. TaxID=2497641 RepID=UPI0025FDBFFA|nr:endonuclease [Thiohalocapsa sp.]MCG6939791.1 endonuclease [Thiohalocapsa sp.]
MSPDGYPQQSAARVGPRMRAVFEVLLAAHGPQHWWPAETPFEVMVGAILTQNTAWTNVEKALARVTGRIALSPEALAGLPRPELADMLRPVGYFNVKAQRLQRFCAELLDAGGEAALAAEDTAALRRRLLAMHGVGPETCDDMLLYAFERPVFVVDAYTRRLFGRLGMLTGTEGYETIRALFEQVLGPDTALFNEYHALIVRHAKDVCRSRRPLCDGCVLRGGCPGAV